MSKKNKNNIKINNKIMNNSDDKITNNNYNKGIKINDNKGIKINDKIIDNSDEKITDNNDNKGIKINDNKGIKINDNNTDKKQKLLSIILDYFFDSAERHNLDNKKVNKVIKDVQYLFKKDPKHKDTECFICKND